MRTFAIYNPLERRRKAVAWVHYESVDDKFSLEVSDAAEPNDLPLALALLVESGQRKAGDRITRMWLSERIPPDYRSNISEVLEAIRVDDYYIPALITATKGRSSQDDFLMEEVPSNEYKTFNLNRVLSSPVHIGVLISRARRAAGLTQAQLAEECGIQQAVVSRIESGKGNPTIETIELLAKACGRTLVMSLE